MALRQPAKKTTSALEMLDFGPGVPVTLTEAGEAAMFSLPQKALRCVLDDLREWIRQAPVTAGRAALYVDPDDSTSRYFLLEFLVTGDEETGGRLLDDLYARENEWFAKLPEKERSRMADGFSVSLTWPDTWDDEPAFYV